MPRKKTPKRRSPKQLRSRQTVEAVLDAVTRILKKQGKDAVTTNRIAVMAGVSIGSVYQYFPDKRAIYRALLDRHLDTIGRLIEDALASSADHSLSKLVSSVVDVMFDVHTIEPELHELLWTEAPRKSYERELQERLRGAWKLALLAKKSELGRPRDLERIVFITGQILESCAHAAVLKRPAHLSLAAAREETVRALLAYLRS